MPSPDQVPAHLLADRQFVTACADRKIGTVFHLAKIRAGIYPAQIARLTGLQTSRVTEYVTSGRVATSMDVCERVADGLGIPGRMLGLADRPWETPATPASYQSAAIPETWEILDMLTRSTASDATLLHLESAVAESAFRYPVTSPAASVPLMQRQLAAVHELLSLPQALGARRRCVRILTVLSGLLGLAYHDCGDRSRSDATFHMGQVAAEESETAELTAWLLTMQSIVDYTAGRTEQAAGLLGQADVLAAGASPGAARGSPRTSAAPSPPPASTGPRWPRWTAPPSCWSWRQSNRSADSTSSPGLVWTASPARAMPCSATTTSRPTC
ncbi:hypothetical protein ACFQ0T_38200 [Kitasatospora gansuensis]